MEQNVYIPEEIRNLDDSQKLRISTVAKICGVSRQTVYKIWIEDSTGPASLTHFHAGNSIRIKAGDLKEFLIKSLNLSKKYRKVQRLCQKGATDYPQAELVEKIADAVREVRDHLKSGLSQSIYEEALSYEFALQNILYERLNQTISVLYKNKEVGTSNLSFIVEKKVLVDVKTGNGMNKLLEDEIKKYCKSKKVEIALIINFCANSFITGIQKIIPN